MSTALHLDMPRVSWEEYEHLLEASEEKLEFRNGVIVAMAGRTEAHSLIKSNRQAPWQRLRKAPLPRLRQR